MQHLPGRGKSLPSLPSVRMFTSCQPLRMQTPGASDRYACKLMIQELMTMNILPRLTLVAAPSDKFGVGFPHGLCPVPDVRCSDPPVERPAPLAAWKQACEVEADLQQQHLTSTATSPSDNKKTLDAMG